MNNLPNSTETDQAIAAFVKTWTIDSAQTKDFFIECYQLIKDMADVSYEFIARPSITYSLRAKSSKSKRPIFVLIDIIDDEPDNRWLSICFYADSLSDPDLLGDFVPKGLFNEDAICFDVENGDTQLHSYLLARIKEAYKSASM